MNPLGIPDWAMPDQPPEPPRATPVLAQARAAELATVPPAPPLGTDWDWERYMGTGLQAGVPITLPGGQVAMPDASGKVTVLRPRASLQVSEAIERHPGVNYDPIPGVPLIQDAVDGAKVVYPLSYFGHPITSTSGDEGQINAALLQSVPAGRPVRLYPGAPFLLQGPVVMAMSANGASVLEGACPVVGEAAGSSGAGIFGSILQPQANFAGIAGLANSQAAVYLAPTQPNGGNKMFGPVLRNFWTDIRATSVGTWGISVYGQVNHLVFQGLGIWGNPADTTSDNIHLDQDAGSEGNNIPDGCTFDTIISQEHGRYGIFAFANDSNFFGTHVQATQHSTTDSGCWWFAKANNVRLIGCRADQGVWGFVFDSNPGGTPNTPGSSIILDGCGTESINHAGLYLRNSSTTGGQTRTPVLATGCSFDFNGRDGTSAAIQVDGWNILTAWNCNITNGGNPYPQIGLQANAVGSGGGTAPSLIVVDGGMWNPAAGGAYVADSTPATTTLRYRFYGAIGAVQGGGAPVNPTLQKSVTWP